MKLFNRKGSAKTEEDEDVLLNAELFEAYRNEPGRAKWGKNVADDRAMWNGAIFSRTDAESLEANNAPIPSIDALYQPISQLISQLTYNKPRFAATARENSDSSLSGTVADTFQYIWDVSEGNERLKKAIEDYEVSGIGALLAYVDPNADNGKGEIFITDVDPEDIFIDPNSKRADSSDAAHILIVQKYNKRQIKDMYPTFDFEGAIDTREEHHEKHSRYEANEQTSRYFTYGRFLKNKDDDIYDIVDRYSKIKVEHYHVYDPNTDFEKILTKEEFEDFQEKIAIASIKDKTKVEYITKQADVRDALKIMEGINQMLNMPNDNYSAYMVNPQTGNPEPPGNNPDGSPIGQLVELSALKFKELINSGVIKVNKILLPRIKRVLTIGEKGFFKDIMPIEEYPIVTFMLHHNRNPYAYGDVRKNKSLVEQLNKSESLILLHATLTANFRVFMPEGGTNMKDVQNRFNQPGVQIFTYNADDNKGGIHKIAPDPLSNEFYINRENYIRQIQNQVGAFSFQDGDVSQAPPTARGTLLMDEMGQRRSRVKKESIEHALNRIAKVVMQMIPYVYTERKIIRITEPNHKTKEFVLNEYNGYEIVNDVSNWNYDIKVVSGSMLPSNRWARFDAYMDMYDRGVIRNNEYIIRESELPNVSEVLEKESTIVQLQNALMQAQEQIKQLSGDMQTKDRELENADRRVADQKYQKQLALQGAKIKTAVDTATYRVNDASKLAINNIKESTKVQGE